MPLIEVKDRFLKDERKQAELEVLLSQQDSQQTEPGVIVYGGSLDFIDAVRIQFSKSGKMVSIQCHANSAERLEKKIDDAIYADHGLAVGRRIIFTNIKIAEQLRLDDSFQIIPTPPGSPEIETPVGDHPAVLEFSYCASPNSIVDMHRRSGRADELSYVLSAFVYYGFKWTINGADFHWVVDRPKGRRLSSDYRQELYFCSDWEQKDAVGFSIVDGASEIPYMQPSRYFGQLGLMPDASFHLPASIREYFQKYESLSGTDKAMALLSAHWLQKSGVVTHTSVSLSFSALVYSLESLMPAPKETGVCDCCGQKIYEKSISQGFRELIEAYAKGIPKKDINNLYALRSGIAHGSRLMAHDQNVGFRFSDPLIKSEQLYRTARNTCQVVFINWLMSR